MYVAKNTTRSKDGTHDVDSHVVRDDSKNDDTSLGARKWNQSVAETYKGFFSDVFVGMLAGVLCVTVATISFNFDLNPIVQDAMHSFPDCPNEVQVELADKQQTNTSKSTKQTRTECNKTITYVQAWLKLYTLAILGGFLGLKLLNVLAKKMLDPDKIKEDVTLIVNDHMSAKLTTFEKEWEKEQEELAVFDYLQEGRVRQDKGYHREAIKWFDKAIEKRTSASALALKSYSESMVEDNPGGWRKALDTALLGMQQERDSNGSDQISKFDLNYNAACFTVLLVDAGRIDLDDGFADIEIYLAECNSIAPQQLKMLITRDLIEGDMSHVKIRDEIRNKIKELAIVQKLSIDLDSN